MAMTNTEKQAAYKERQRTAGAIRKELWIRPDEIVLTLTDDELATLFRALDTKLLDDAQSLREKLSNALKVGTR